MATPNFVAKKSAWAAVTLLRVLFFWLIIPLIIMIIDIMVKKSERIEFYDDYIIQRSGVLSKKEKRSAMVGIMGVSVSQTFGQRIFGYGDVVVDVVGKWNINTNDIANPNALKEYLEPLISKASHMQGVIIN